MINDVPESPYIILGLLSYCLLTSLAVTSTAGMMRRLGQRWFTLHKVIYAIAIMGVVHFFWLTKLDYVEPLIYAFLLTILFALRWSTFKNMLLALRAIKYT
jgi:sulfoxide reductase heme-binding subunit YedZ